MAAAETTPKYTFKDFHSGQQVRWCPGCGDIAILRAVQTAFAKMGIPKEKFVVVSGIGCSSRFPYYMATYGIHGIHGRAGALATGIKLANPDLSVWQITGDGDGLAIGGNHFIHEIRRNIDVNILLFNNKIYGLTKGQYSPTTPKGFKTKTSPYGTIEDPFNPGELAIGAGATFFARSIYSNLNLSVEILLEAQKHKGTSVVEFLQTCVIFNKNAYDHLTKGPDKENNFIIVRHGEPMIFGKNRDMGLILDKDSRIKVVKIGENGITEKDLLVHNAHDPNPMVHYQLAALQHPVVFGVIRSVQKETYEEALYRQIEEVKKMSNYNTLEELLHSGNTWEVK
jgi:2-oxoglutarate ferredoxin oxidoreductase subunit beta